MPTLYAQYQQLTPKEREYLHTHPHHAVILRGAREAAFAETIRRFGPNGHSDKSDAFRHCFWSAILARDIGYQDAMRFTTAHESSPKNRIEEKRMDLHNNRVGLGIGFKKGTNAVISERCMSALHAGKLQVLVE